MKRVMLISLLCPLCAIASASEGTHQSPVYLNWEFWSAIFAGIAIALSQFPPVVSWFKPARRLDVETLSRIVVTHKIGNPNLGLYISIRNSGRSDTRIRAMNLRVERDHVALGDYPSQNYFESMTSKESTLLVAFTVKPGEIWAHTVNFLKEFDRTTEKWYRQSESALREDIRVKVAARATDAPKVMVEADPELIQPFIRFFEQHFVWLPGEYLVQLTIATDHATSAVTKNFRFTLFESDSGDLRAAVDDYKYGAGISWDRSDKKNAFLIPIVPVDVD